MDRMLHSKTAIVTGGAQGIGKAIAKMFFDEGAQVVLCDTNREAAEKSAKEIDPSGKRSIAIKADVRNQTEIDAVVQETLGRFGRIDILVNNAAVFRQALLVEMKEEEWDLVYDINVKGVFLFSQAVGKVMIKQRSGRIINLSSCSGKKPDWKQGAYNSSKSAILGLNRVLALELGPHGINVNAICPGATDTEMVRSTFLTSPEIERDWIEKTAVKRLGRPEDVAKTALFLASDLSSHITGEAIIVSGGELMTQ